jgi:hypothetical protein
LFYDRDNDCIAELPSGKPGKVTVKKALEPGQVGYFFNVQNNLENENFYKGSAKLKIRVIGRRYAVTDGQVKIQGLRAKIKKFNDNRESDCNLVNWYHYLNFIAIVFDRNDNEFFNEIHGKLIDWVAKIGKQEELAQEPYTNPDFQSWKKAISNNCTN